MEKKRKIKRRVYGTMARSMQKQVWQCVCLCACEYLLSDMTHPHILASSWVKPSSW